MRKIQISVVVVIALLFLTAIAQSVEIGGVQLFKGIRISDSLCFSSDSTQCLMTGGSNTIQTGANTSVAVMGNVIANTDVRVAGRIVNTGSGANCTGFGAAVVVDDATGFCVANGSGTPVTVVKGDGSVKLSSITAPTYGEALMFYDSTAKSLVYYNDNSSVSVNVGQEQLARVYNNTGSTISNGAAVYATGRDTTNDIMTVALADADADTTAEVLGLVTTSNCTTATVCYVTKSGRVNTFDTSGLTAGAPFYLSSTAGGLTSTIPTAPARLVRLGMVGRSDASNGWVDVATGIVKTSESTGVSSGAFAVNFVGIGEGADGNGAYTPVAVGAGTKFRFVSCTCRLAGSGGTNGIFLDLFENGSQVSQVEVVGADGNACNETSMSRDFNYAAVAGALYTVRIDATTDCAVNPTDCACNTDVTR